MSHDTANPLFKKRSVWLVIYTVYLSLVLLSVTAFIAEESVDDIRDNMDEHYDYYLTFRTDGKTTHYDVTRHDTGKNGRISLRYYTDANKLSVSKVENIKTLKIDVRSMFEDESQKVFKKSHTAIPNMDMDYWLEAGDGIFTIEFNIASGQQLESLTFTEFPEPESVLVNNKEWWQTELNYDIDDDEITVSKIPTGKTTVIIDFSGKKMNELPVPSFVTDPEGKAGVNEKVSFDASKSYDTDGEIENYLWDFGDDTEGSGRTASHTYTKPGTYTIRLTVRDDSTPYGEAWIEKDLTVEYGAEDDFDSDGLSDKWEWENFNSLTQGPAGDPDNDDYNNKLEYLTDTDPIDGNDYKEDSDGDGLPDLWEWEFFESLQYNENEDPDADLATNKDELDAFTDPSDPNSKPRSDEDDGEGGMQGLGTVAGVDTFLLILLIIIILILAYIAILVTISRAGAAKREEREAKERRREAERRAYSPMYTEAETDYYYEDSGEPYDEYGEDYMDPELAGEEEVMLVCPGCGEYVDSGIANCPVCNAEI